MRVTRWIVLGSLACIVLVIAAFVFFGTTTRFYHVPQKAAAAAWTFARTAFVEQNYKHAFASLDDKVRSELTVERIIETIKQMHPIGFPLDVEPEDYEPMPGQKAMMIYLVGSNGGEKMYYRFVMAGDDESGYRVSGFFRGSGPYPHSSLRKRL